MHYYSFTNRLIYLSKGIFAYCLIALGLKKSRKMEKCIEIFLSNHVIDRSQVARIRRDMAFCQQMYHISYEEYFLFQFYDRNKKSRRSFIGKAEKGALTSFINNNTEWDIFHKKYNTFLKFQQYYKRDVESFDETNILDKTRDFLKVHEKCIVKPDDLSCGRGVVLLNRNDDIQTELKAITHGVIEEVIEQDGQLGVFHPASVNTVRITTYVGKNGVTVLYALLRMGANNSLVDNAGAGGVIAAIDIDTGIIKTGGFRENGSYYLFHPDTKTRIIGTAIPEWEKLIQTVKELAMVVPTQKLIGWDMAYSKKGWCVIEGNNVPAFTGIQMCERKGIREMIEHVVNEYDEFI